MPITHQEDKEKIIYSFIISGFFVLILWIIKIIEEVFGLSFAQLGVYPKKISGLIGIIFSPLIHGDFSHLISNTSTLFFVFFGILYFYRSSAYKVFLIIYLGSGLMVWLVGRPSYHIGASGLVYGFVSFLFFSGVFRKDRRAVGMSLLIAFLYGGLVWGVLPIQKGVSFEAHLFGALIGLLCAFIFRKSDPPQKYEWEEEEDEDDDDYDDGYDDDDIDPDDVKIEDDATPRHF